MKESEIDSTLAEEYPIFFMQMNEMQKKFFRIKNKNHQTPKRRLNETGNKGGKTRGGIMEDVAHAWGYRPWLDESDPDYKIEIKVPNIGLIGCETLSQTVMQKIWPELKALIPKTAQYRPKKNPMGQITEIRFETGPQGEECKSEIYIRSYDQDADTFEGVDYDWIHWDEPPPKKILQAAERGKIASNAPSWFTMTPLKEAYIYDEYSLKAFNNGGDDQEIAVIRGEIWDNCSDYCYKCRINILENSKNIRQLSKCPQCGRSLGFITKAGIDEYLKTLDPEEREAREKGLWKHLSGLVYKILDNELHVYDDFPIPRNWTKLEGIDPHDAKPVKYLFGAVSPEEIEIKGKVRNRIYFYDYLSMKNVDLDELIRRIKSKRETHGYSKPKWIIIDAKYGARTQLARNKEDKKSWEEELQNRGLGYIKLSQSEPGDLTIGHSIVREYLKPHYSILDGKSKPGILFARDGCRGKGGPINMMFNYQYKEDADKPEEEFKDFPDIVRYICMEQPLYSSPESELTIKNILEQRMEHAMASRRRGISP